MILKQIIKIIVFMVRRILINLVYIVFCIAYNFASFLSNLVISILFNFAILICVSYYIYHHFQTMNFNLINQFNYSRRNDYLNFLNISKNKMW